MILTENIFLKNNFPENISFFKKIFSDENDFTPKQTSISLKIPLVLYTKKYYENLATSIDDKLTN
jgi:hypothetical protein